ncbi:hypothetical protein [Salinigranum halophilum]|uniref:hypothetical protein n=1 Tax=Salinigranum halophilum TaxID=2565931 RepID=UPI00115D0A5C|nr:hypothetical protein [Salinigranum halophilum]
MSANEADESRPSREIAYRLFAAEFDDASFSYSESDEERAPNYVVTPTGARVNRLFAVGVLTEVEPVNDDVLRGRIVDPTGAFVSYAGQYQPDEMAFLDRASPPAFVALSGKARTFQPDDSDRVFTSVRPESMSRVDADTRDRWTVSTAEATLDRVGVMAAALRSGLRGGDLSEALLGAGVDEALAKGVPLAIDHYGTTPGYLAALRRLALDALEVVADDRDSVRALGVEPGDTGADVDLGDLAADLDLAVSDEDDAAAPASPEAAASDTDTAEPAQVDATDEQTAAAPDAAEEAESIPEFDEEPSATAAAPETAEPTVDAADTTDTREPETTSTASPASTTETSASEEPSSDPEAETATSETDAPTSTVSSEAAASSEPTAPTESGASTDDELGDFDAGGTDETGPSTDELGDFDAGATAPPTETAETQTGDTDATDDLTVESESGTDGTDDGGDAGEAGDDGMYELDAEERAQIEAEFGTEFATGSEVAPAGEADIDVPSVDELEAERDESAPSEAASPSEAATDAAAPEASEPDPATVAGETDAAADETEAVDAGDDEAGADVDLEAVAVEAMDALDDGDGASREAVVAHVVDEYGADPEAVEDAIQSALMSGQCYEPTEDSLKAI